MKKLLLLLLLLVIAIAVGTHLFGASLLKAGIERGGSHALKTDVHVGGASLSLLAGEVRLKQVHIHNPEGFQTDDALSVKKIQIAADVKSLLDEIVTIETIEIRRPDVTLELNQHGTNYQRLLKNLEKESSPTQESDEAGKQLLIGRVVITEPQVTLAQSVLIPQQVQLTLPTIELENVGSAQDPLTLPELLHRILGAILAATKGADELPAELIKAIDTEIDQLLDLGSKRLAEELEELGDRTSEAADQLTNEVQNELKKGLNDLLGGKND